MTHNVYDRGPRQHATGTVSGAHYTVAAGDTYFSIGQRFGLPYQAILKANGLKENDWVTPGTQLLIPGLGSPPDVYDRGPREHAMGSVSGAYYTVAAGDTYFSIGQRFGLPYQAILKANGLKEEDWVTPGTQLLIPGLSTPPPQPPQPPSPPRLGINSPTYGSTVHAGSPLTVAGIGRDLAANKIVVRIRNQSGVEVTRSETFLDANGNWSVTFAPGLPVAPNTTGTIEAEAPANNLRTDIVVNFR